MENNLAEPVLKLFIRQRKNSLFDQNPHSAYIASVLTSLIATCIYAGAGAGGLPGGAAREPTRGVFEPIGVAAVGLCLKPDLALSHASPVLCHLGPVGLSIPEQDKQFSSGQRHPCIRALGPPRKATRRQSFEHHPIALAVVKQELQ